MRFISNRYVLKIPSQISVLYCKEKKKLLISNGLKKMTIDLQVKLKILKQKNCIVVTDQPFYKVSSKASKQNKSLQGKYYFIIKKTFKNIKTVTCKKLKLVGVGYKVFLITNGEVSYKLLHFKLGYSHNIYYKIPKNLEVKIRQSNKIFILGHDYDLVSKTASVIRSYKYPEPYKGKGILYFNESIELKEGKKL